MGIRIALAGNPNCGKTTMFNDLTGANQYVGNWPGVTVEKKEGKYTKDKDVTVTDLPGIYSLSPYSPEEIVARDYLLDGDPDVVINLIDATNLERNLYLTTQILELGLPVVIALNMMDLVEKNGDKIDVDKLSRELGCPIVPTSALKGRSMDELVKTAIELGKKGVPAAPQIRFSDEIETALAKIIDVLGSRVSSATARWFAIKVLEGEERTISQLKLTDANKKTVDAIRDALETELDDDAESIVTSARYDEIAGVVDDTVKKSTKGMSTTQKIDRVVTNRFLGLPIFIVIMFFVYWLAVSVGGGVVTDWANDGISGDGWLYTGGEAFDEATAEYEDAQAQITAYVENILGEDEVSGLPSDDAQEVLDALALAEPEAPEDATDVDAMAEYEDAVAEYDDAQATIAAFDEEAQAKHAVATMEVEGDDGEVEEQAITFADYQAALEVEEPDPSDGSWGLWIPGLGAIIGNALETADVAPWLQSLVMDGIVAGVGAVIGFIPQMVILFLLLGFLELCGYMSRVAFIMDRIFRKFGLSGKSFIPVLVGTGCGVPGIMASRTIENERDRRMTIMTTCFIPCGAKMPIIGLIAGALFGGSSVVAVSAYFIGMAAIILSGIILKKTKLFAGDPAPFVMELPAYHVPAWGNVFRATWERGWSFIKRAGSVILASTVILWFLQGFGFENGAFGMIEDQDNSILAIVATKIAWIFAPLGFGNWKATVASVSGLIAKENVVGTFGVLYHFGGELSENGDEIWAAVAQDYTALSAYAFMIFNLLCAPCFAAMGAIKREMNNGRWTAIAIGYMCALAYCAALVVYQLGGIISGEVGFNFFTIVAVVILVAFIYLLVRPNKYTGINEVSIDTKKLTANK